MGEFKKPEIDKKDFVSSKLYDDLISGKYPDRFYKHWIDSGVEPHFIKTVVQEGGEFAIGTYLYTTVKQRDNDAFQLRAMSCPIFEEC